MERGRKSRIARGLDIGHTALIGESAEVLYPSPKLPVEEWSEFEIGHVIGLIEGEGSFFVHLVRSRLIKNYILPPEQRVYRYNYIIPYFNLRMTDEQPVRKIQEAFHIGFTITPPKLPRVKAYTARTTKAEEAIVIAQWALPLLTPQTRAWKEAKYMLTIFKETPAITITPQQARTLLPIRKGERWETLLDWRSRGLI